MVIKAVSTSPTMDAFTCHMPGCCDVKERLMCPSVQIFSRGTDLQEA
jgi:hypothetical protein